jgi:uncharacterized membrane protein
MDGVHLHLLLNHIPVFGMIFATPLFAYALLRRSDELKRLSLIILVLAALSAIPVYLTGEPAEETVEKLAGVSEAIIEQHEDSAKLSLIFAIVTGAISLIGIVLMRSKQEFARWFVLLSLLFSMVTAVLMARTANLGGQVRHTEIRSGDAVLQKPEQREARKESDDDDH